MLSFAGNRVCQNYELNSQDSLLKPLLDYATHLIKTLNEKNFMVAIEGNLITNYPTHQHNNFIVLDLACENVPQLLEQVNI